MTSEDIKHQLIIICTGEAVYDRVTILPSTLSYLLHAVLDHVTCYDAINYTCYIVVNPQNFDSPPAAIYQSQQFVYQGKVYVM